MSSERIFISYSNKDGKQFADNLRKELESRDFSIWQDLVALQAGQDWWTQIEEALRSPSLDHFILVVTPGAQASKIVRDEIRLAKQEGKTFIPVKGPGINDLNDLPRWYGHIYDWDMPEHKNKLLEILKGRSLQQRAPMMAPEPPKDFVSRPKEFDALKQQLLKPNGDAVAITAALRGAGGYGKTTLAKALAHDDDILDAYFDGILWVELGEKPDNLTGTISGLIARMTGERPFLENLNEAASMLGETLGNRRILLIIDDVWRQQDLVPFMQGGASTTRLITTRNDTLLPPGTERQIVDAMAEGEALELISWGLPDDQLIRHRSELVALVERLGEWAQLLKLANGFLLQRVVRAGQPLADALAGVNKRLDARGLTAFDTRNAEDRSLAVAKTISISLELLEEHQRDRFLELGVFPEDEDIPLGVVARYWERTGGLDEFDTEDLLSELFSLSLLLNLDLDKRTFRLHDTVRHYLIGEAGGRLAGQHRALVESLSTADGPEAEPGYYYQHLPLHLHEAGAQETLNTLLLDPKWLQDKLNTTRDPQSLIADYDAYATTEAQRLIGRTLRLCSGILVRDPQQLVPQLTGRLMALKNAELSAFCSRAYKLCPTPALITIPPSLTPPGAELQRFEGHTHWVNAVTQLADGRIASASSDTTIRLWDKDSGTLTTTLEGHTEWVRAVTQLADGRIASASDDKTIRLWDKDSGTLTATLEGHTDIVTAVTQLADGRIASCSGGYGSSDNTIRLWDKDSGTLTATLEGHTGGVRAVTQLADGRIASASQDKTIRLWDKDSGTLTTTLEGHTDVVMAVTQLADGRIASASSDNTIRLWDKDSGTLTAALEGHTYGVNAVTQLADGCIASASSDQTIRLWDKDSSTLTATLEGHTHAVMAVTQLADGRIASASRDNTIRLWDKDSGTLTATLEGHTGWVEAVTQLADGRIASASWDNTIRLWDKDSGTLTATLEGHTDAVTAVTQLADGRIASASNDNTIRLWDKDSGTLTATLEGHTNTVTAVTQLADGRIASASHDKTIRLWDGETGKELCCLEVDAPVGALCVREGRGLVAGDNRGRLHWLEVVG